MLCRVVGWYLVQDPFDNMIIWLYLQNNITNLKLFAAYESLLYMKMLNQWPLKMSFIVYWVFENLEEESTVASKHLLFNWFSDVLQGKDIQSAICVLSHSTLMQLTIRNLFPHSIQQATRGWFTKRHLFSSSTWRWCNNTSLTVALKYKTQEEFSLCVVNAALELTLYRIFIVK